MKQEYLKIKLRPYPYPYKSMLAICSDLDETPDRKVYWEIMRFLNTTEDTAMGPGVGLEVGNSIYFDMAPDQFAYWNTDDTGREMVRTLIKSGHIDCLHSYGDLATTRKHAQKALNELAKHNCKLQVWIDHAIAPTNFDQDIMQGHGAEVGHDAYHGDLTVDYGIKYVWRGRVTSMLGQDIPAKMIEMFDAKHPLASSRTLLKEAMKRKIARDGNEKYAMHGPNETLRKSTLNDGQPIYEFLRCNPHWGGVSSCEEGRSIGEVITERKLKSLIDREGSCILYTHLGKIENPAIPFNPKAVNAFRYLAQLQQEDKILVTTTRRLLGYRRAFADMKFNVMEKDNCLHININMTKSATDVAELSKADLYGLTFYVPYSEKTIVFVDGKKVENLQKNPKDNTGRASVSIGWSHLEFPSMD